jgi:hypothetical protein
MSRPISSRGGVAAQRIAALLPFDTYGALRAEAFAPGTASGTPGRLNDVERESFMRALSTIVYIVYSYTTPIAWVCDGSAQAHIVDQKFSATTSKHQGVLYLLKGRTL